MKINAWTLLLIFIILYFVFQIRQDVLRYYGLVSEKDKLKQSIVDTNSDNQGLKKRISALNENRTIDGLARERLNLVRKGETAFKVCRSTSDRK